MSMQHKIFVTGGTGLVGSNLLRLLLEKGHQNIFALHRESSDMSLVSDLKDKVNWVEGDVLDVMALEQVMQDASQVYHCAAIVSFDPREYKLMDQINIQGTANMVNMALQLEVDKFLHVSSIAALGRSEGVKQADESTEWQDSPWNTRYAISKYQSEMEVWRAAHEGLPVAIVNPSVIMGSGFWHKGTGRFFKIVDEGLKFYPTGSTGFVDVEDVAAYMYALMESDIINERFLLNGENLPYQKVFNTIADHIKKPRPSIKVTPLLKALAWRVEKMKSIFFGSSPKVTRETAHNSSTDIQYDAKKSQDTFGIEYQSVLQSIEAMSANFLESKKISTLH